MVWVEINYSCEIFCGLMRYVPCTRRTPDSSRSPDTSCTYTCFSPPDYSSRLFLHFFNTSEFYSTPNCERTVRTCHLLHCSLCLVQKSVHQLLSCWVDVVAFTLFAAHSVVWAAEQRQRGGAVMWFRFGTSQIEHECIFHLTNLWPWMCVYCFIGDVWEGVGKSNIRVTGRVCSRHSLPNRELLFFFFRGGGVQSLCGNWIRVLTSESTISYERHCRRVCGNWTLKSDVEFSCFSVFLRIILMTLQECFPDIWLVTKDQTRHISPDQPIAVHQKTALQ